MRNIIRESLVNGISKLYKFQLAYQDIAAKKLFASAILNGGEECQIKHPIYLYGPQYIEVGKFFVAGADLRMEAYDAFNGQKFTPKIIIGDNVIFNFNVHLGAVDLIKIGNDVLIGSNVLITDHSHGCLSVEEASIPARLRLLHVKGPTIIEDNVWIGENACILSGVRVGKGAIIGANAVVTRDVAPGDVVGGVPAKVLRSIAQPAHC